MLIANPGYDVVFKYMMEDSKVAKIFLSAVSGKNVVAIDVLPQELSGDSTNAGRMPSLGLTVYRLDFACVVRYENGEEEVIIIEVQKAKMYNEIMRFRKYLGKQYMNENHSYEKIDIHGRRVRSGKPIYSIYFLGEGIPGYENHPVIRVKTRLTDNVTEKELSNHNNFVKSLYHEGTIISISALKGKRQNDLEQLLAIFDQENRTEDMHIMNVKEQDFPKEFRPIIHRLQKAVQVKEVRDVMEIEDDFIKEIMDYEERVKIQEALVSEERFLKEEAQRKQEEAQRKQEEAQRKQEEAQRKQEEAQRKQEEAQRKQEEAQRKQEEAQRKQNEAIKLMLRSGIDKSVIAEKLQLSIHYIESLK
jgi:hypothetical protein